jgi:hypothetical protein
MEEGWLRGKDLASGPAASLPVAQKATFPSRGSALSRFKSFLTDGREWLRGKDLNLRPLGYAYHYSFRCLDEPVCGLDFLFTLDPAFAAVRVPAVKSLHLP